MSIISFGKNDERCEIRLANFLAVLVKEGIKYTIQQDQFAYEVRLTGGF